MSFINDTNELKQDPTAAARKKDHIDLAFKAVVEEVSIDNRFYYEPMLSGHPTDIAIPETDFLGYKLQLPIWVSSMTGGTQWAKTINTNLAKACSEYGIGMGLGSCRALLFDDDRIEDFDVKTLMPNQPLYANLGIAQIEELHNTGKLSAIDTLIKKLNADGLIIHVNPLQEWLQPEGDRYEMSPIELITRVIDTLPELSIIVKEVGQGFGPKSIEALYNLPIGAVDFGASGGTNFSLLELLRSHDDELFAHEALCRVGHSAAEMVAFVNSNIKENQQCKQTIISGGIKNYLDGYYNLQKLKRPAIYGQASSFLKYAQQSYEHLQQHMERQKAGLQVAYSFLTVK